MKLSEKRKGSFITDDGELSTEFFDEYHDQEYVIDIPHKRKRTRSWFTHWFLRRSLKFRLLTYLLASLGSISLCTVSVSLVSIENLISIPIKLFIITLITVGLPLPNSISSDIPLLPTMSIGCTKSGSWNLQNTIFTINIKQVEIANVGGHRNLLTIATQVTNQSDYNIKFELNANLRFIYESQVFGPSVGMSKWPTYLGPHKNFDREIVIDQTPDDISSLNLEFQRISINGLSLKNDDPQLVSLGITSLSIPGIPSNC